MIIPRVVVEWLVNNNLGSRAKYSDGTAAAEDIWLLETMQRGGVAGVIVEKQIDDLKEMVRILDKSQNARYKPLY